MLGPVYVYRIIPFSSGEESTAPKQRALAFLFGGVVAIGGLCAAIYNVSARLAGAIVIEVE